ncbi:terminase family protein, partial [bacterium]|nr:terminase family protein [bacterium]
MKTTLKYIILFLIQLIEKWEYRHMSLDENDIQKKILDTILLSNLKIDTPQGFKPIKEIHKTQPYQLWKIETENGLSLECADKHIIFNNQGEQTFVKDLRIGHYIKTKNGLDKILSIKRLPFKVSMFDVTVDSYEHEFYSNDIVSHNTTTISAYFAWYLCFHNDRNLAILANKQATAFEIVNKVTDVFKGLPFFLKPGITSIGAGGMRLDNGCFLMSQATTKTAQIGFTIHVLYADEFAHIQKNIATE